MSKNNTVAVPASKPVRKYITCEEAHDALAQFASEGKNTYPPNEANFEPIQYKVLVKVDHVEEKTSGGIIIPETERDRHQHATSNGTVVAVGDCACTGEGFTERQRLQPGDRVVIKKYGGEILEVNGDREHWRVVLDTEVFGRWMSA